MSSAEKGRARAARLKADNGSGDLRGWVERAAEKFLAATNSKMMR